MKLFAPDCEVVVVQAGLAGADRIVRESSLSIGSPLENIQDHRLERGQRLALVFRVERGFVVLFTEFLAVLKIREIAS